MENIDLVTLLVQLVSGAVGGNIAGLLLRNLSLGAIGNTLAGIIGGGVGGQLLTTMLALPAVAPVDGAMEPAAILGQVASGGGGGIAVMIVIGILRSIFGK